MDFAGAGVEGSENIFFQKGLGAVPGISPITFSPRAMARMKVARPLLILCVLIRPNTRCLCRMRMNIDRTMVQARTQPRNPLALDMRKWFGYLCGKNAKGVLPVHFWINGARRPASPMLLARPGHLWSPWIPRSLAILRGGAGADDVHQYFTTGPVRSMWINSACHSTMWIN